MDENKLGMGGMGEILAFIESQEPGIRAHENKQRKIYGKLNIPPNLSWGGFSYYRNSLSIEWEDDPDRKEIYRFFWKNDPAATFNAQISLDGESHWRHVGRYQHDDPGQNSTAEQDIEYLSKCAHEVGDLVKASGGAVIGINPLLLTEEEKRAEAEQAARKRQDYIEAWFAKGEGTREEIAQSYDRFHNGVLADFSRDPPIHYVEIRANAATLRAIAALGVVESIQLIRRPSNAPPRENPRMQRLKEMLVRYDESSADPSP